VAPPGDPEDYTETKYMCSDRLKQLLISVMEERKRRKIVTVVNEAIMAYNFK
jgi:hypothetical protein